MFKRIGIVPSKIIHSMDVGKNNGSRHKEYRSFCLRTYRYSSGKISKPVSAKEDEIVLLDYKQDVVLSKQLQLHPEAAAYLFHLEGCPNKLLTYLLFFAVDEAGEVKWNSYTISQFKHYCELFDKKYTDAVIKSAMRRLEGMNIVLNLKRGLYMINPLLHGGKTPDGRRELISKYCRILLQKGKCVEERFYPLYQERGREIAGKKDVNE